MFHSRFTLKVYQDVVFGLNSTPATFQRLRNNSGTYVFTDYALCITSNDWHSQWNLLPEFGLGSKRLGRFVVIWSSRVHITPPNNAEWCFISRIPYGNILQGIDSPSD